MCLAPGSQCLEYLIHDGPGGPPSFRRWYELNQQSRKEETAKGCTDLLSSESGVQRMANFGSSRLLTCIRSSEITRLAPKPNRFNEQSEQNRPGTAFSIIERNRLIRLFPGEVIFRKER